MTESDAPGEKDTGTDYREAGEAALFGDDASAATDEQDANQPDDDPTSESKAVQDGFDIDLNLGSIADAPDEEIEACKELFRVVKRVVFEFDSDDNRAPIEAVREEAPDDLAVSVDEWISRADRANAIKSEGEDIVVTDTDVGPSTIADAVDPVDPGRKELTEAERCEHFAERNDWSTVKEMYRGGDRIDYTKEEARHAAYRYLRGAHDWMLTDLGEDKDKPDLWWYDPDEGVWKPNGTHHAKRLINNGLDEHSDNHERNEIVEKVRLSADLVSDEELDAKTADDPMVCVANGVVNMRTLELKDFDPSHRFTWKVDIEYHKNAVPERVLRFMRDIFERNADVWTFLQIIAEGLMPRRIDRAFGILYGPGKNGKSQLTKLFREHFYGKNLTSTVGLDQIVGDDEFASGGLQDSRANFGSEAEHATVRNVSDLKEYTGGDGSQGNRKYKRREDFVYQGAMVFTANEPPAFEEDTDAIKDRLYPLPLPYKFTAEDDEHKDRVANIANKISTEDELEGLLTLLLHAGQELIEDEAFACPESADERVERYEAAADPYKRFKREYLVDAEVTQENEVDPDDVVAVYRRMCADQGERAMNSQVFKEKITNSTDLRVRKIQSSPFARRHNTDADQPTVWRGLRFAESAATYMPADIAARYGVVEYDLSVEDGDEEEENTTSSDEEEEEDDGDRLTPIEDLEVGMTADIAAPIAGVSDGPPWVEERGMIHGDNNGIKYQAEFHAPGLEVGETYVLEDVRVVSDEDGFAMVEITPSTDVEKIDVDSVQAPMSAINAEGDEDDDPDCGAGGDSEEEEENGTPQAERLPALVRTIDDIADEESGAPHDAVLKEADAGEETVEDDLKTLKQKGVVYEPDRGTYRATKRPQEVAR